MKATHLFILICFLVPCTLLAQDYHFSQFQLSPLYLNPALAGTDCNARLSANYRNQWFSVLNSNSFRTYTASYDQPIALKNRDQLGVGANFSFDESGQLDHRTIGLSLFAAYHKAIGEQHTLSGGLSVGFRHRSINLEKGIWGSQHNGNGGFDPNAEGEPFDSDSFNFIDFDLGLNWLIKMNDGNEIQTGLAIAHLNRPNQSFDTAQNLPLYTKISFYGIADFNLATRLSLLPRLNMLFQGPSFAAIIGNGFQLQLNETGKNNLEMGAGCRIANRVKNNTINQNSTTTGVWVDALIFNLAFSVPKFTIGLSYDHNVSSLQSASNGKGSIEAIVIYQFCSE
jgi:type IX secretion system PorP/SprF family membrane protein